MQKLYHWLLIKTDGSNIKGSNRRNGSNLAVKLMKIWQNNVTFTNTNCW